MSSAYGHHSQDLSELKEYTLEDLQPQVKLEPTFHQNFLKLPRVHDVGYDVRKSILLKASLPERIHVGYVHILYGPGSGERRYVLAYINSDTNPVSIDGVHFCLVDNTVISRKAVPQIDLRYPFNECRSSEVDYSTICERLRTLVLYYFLATGFVRRIGLTEKHWCSFKLVCATLAKSKTYQVSSYEVEPIPGVELLRAQNRFLDVTNDEPTEIDAISRTEQGDEHTGKLGPNGKRESH
jgi:hypothetical protein